MKEWLIMGNSDSLSYRVGSKSFTAVAINAASKAGEWIKSKQGAYQNLDMKSSSKDLVTEIDKGSETLIKNLLHTHFPQHEIWGEEGIGDDNPLSLDDIRDEEYAWIVDPIDGTTNFVHGFPFYSVSIALAYRGEIIVGVIYDPSQDEMFVAEKGKGAYLRGKPMVVSNERSLEESLIGSGFSNTPGSMELNLQAMTELLPKVRNIRTTGSAALHLAYVAAGRISGFCELGLNPWDVAAGALLVQESGGKVTDVKGTPYGIDVCDIVATNGHIHRELLDVVGKY